VSGTPRWRETAVTPPSNSMMSEAVIGHTYDNRRLPVNWLTNCGVVFSYEKLQAGVMLDTQQLLARLKERQIRNVDIARVLKLPDSRIPEIRDGRRALKLDEGAKLVRAFGLEQEAEAQPLPLSVLRLAVRHVARRAGAPMDDAVLNDLAEDLRAFSLFAADPTIRQSVEAAEGFFRALQTRRLAPEEEGPPENDPAHTH
jgi:hypothetical protein